MPTGSPGSVLGVDPVPGGVSGLRSSARPKGEWRGIPHSRRPDTEDRIPGIGYLVPDPVRRWNDWLRR